jgi:DNA invertase Pin-like site-specific DNA recombinase
VNPKTTEPKRAVCYVRISQDRKNETSTTTQEERVRAHCQAQGWKVVDVIVEPGRSAYKTSRKSRPQFRRVMELIRSGAADVLVVWKLDRAARDLRDLLELVDELKEHGARFASVTEHIDTSTPSGRMLMQVLGSLAEMESATKSERLQAWQEHRGTSGAVPTGPRPFGYRREHNKLLIVEDEADILRSAADRVLAGDALRGIAKDLAGRGVAGTNGAPIDRTKLRQMLLCPTIAACREVGGERHKRGDRKRGTGTLVESDAWEPILDRATWEKVRAVLTDPSRRTGTSNARRWWLTGIATCGRCEDDVRMVVGGHQAGPRYQCPKCGLATNAARTDELLEAALLSMLDAKTWRRLRQGQPFTVESDGFETAMHELADRFSAGDIDAVQLGDLAEALRRQYEPAAPPPSLPDVTDLRKAWPKLDLMQRRLVFSAATESLKILPWQHKNSFDEERVVWEPVA